ncbi:MAG: hypothetical protein MJ230_05665 [bacterium]|nr:hypothetical protein [bacterium]
MNIETSQIAKTNDVKQVSQTTVKNDENNANFSDELDKLKGSEMNDENVLQNNEVMSENENENVLQNNEIMNEYEKENDATKSTVVINQNFNPINGESSKVGLVGNAIEDLSSVLNQINKPNENCEIEKTLVTEGKQLLENRQEFKNEQVHNNDVVSKAINLKDNIEEKEEGENLINNDFSIDNKDNLPQMTPNMNFSGDGQPFSSFMNNEEHKKDEKLVSSAKELEEENAILSTMAENIAMANKVQIDEPQVKVISKNDGLKKIDTKTNIVQETIVKYDTIIMNEADVEVFTDLVQNKEVDITKLAPESAQKSVHVSKTLADMLAKAMEDNKPVRIEFDNGISVIIKISRGGKLSADFLPSTQVAEAYLKENLPVLKQRFDEQNIDYDELNRRERRNQDREQNRKKGRENE